MENGARLVQVLGVKVVDNTMDGALRDLETRLEQSRHQSAYFVNAHTLNLATEDARYRDVLNSADIVFGDGTGVRWAARIRGVQLKANLNGTDIVPALLRATASKGYRCYLLGNKEESIARAAAYFEQHFQGWVVAGFHHGFLDEISTDQVVRRINESQSHLLLVGMGNPRQEQWIAQNKGRLNVKLSMGVGGLFDYWAGNIQRAPAWVRNQGSEWLYILAQQPKKIRRYIVGNPKFLYRMLHHLPRDLS